eukprot:TRINITY_DN11774_c0_g1_i1.p1 TRINITY_DN11774_c0_g1~~TRINITY_DN11774_c0_g1_i1.p1  ORF type:complete len:528 (-),score=114.47 TRINITY_DN11774_c0_g1_i1:376-1959(-)
MTEKKTEEKTNAIPQLLKSIRDYFNTGVSKSLDFRITQLKNVKRLLQENEQAWCTALQKDLGKCTYDCYLTEINIVVAEINEMVKMLPSWAKDEDVTSPLFVFPAKSYIHYEPEGVVLIIGPFNYPVHLVLMPLVSAISAGNLAIIKPTSACPSVSSLLAQLIPKYLDPKGFAVVQGSVSEATKLLEQKFDHIFFTGSVDVGKTVMKAASAHLTPVTLELGGKSPVIVHKDADLALTARRLMWAKCLNTGQTCVAPDYVYVHKSIKKQLVAEMTAYLKTAYGTKIQESKDFSRIVSQKHTLRLKSYLDEHLNSSSSSSPSSPSETKEASSPLLFGGEVDVDNKYVAPTLIDESMCPHKGKCKLMHEEIFGPILPIIEYEDVQECLKFINSRPKPLAFYIFTSDTDFFHRLVDDTSSGQAVQNDCIIHLGNSFLPFGGVGESGMGRYHGKYSFQTFSHHRAVLEKSEHLDIPHRYPPYTSSKQYVINTAMLMGWPHSGTFKQFGYLLLFGIAALLVYRFRSLLWGSSS